MSEQITPCDEELQQAYKEFYRLEREEHEAVQQADNLGTQRSLAATRVRELGGKL